MNFAISNQYLMRYKALDYLRGLTIILMIIVNTPGSWSHVYPALLHADWQGFTITDTIFPFFLYIVGAALWFSFDKCNHQISTALSLKIIKRTVILFGIGIFLNKFPYFFDNWEHVRIMGVLQRIALCYMVAAFAVLLLSRTMLYIFMAFFLLGYWWLMYAYAPHGAPYALETNFARYIDLFTLGANHLWKGMGLPFDPEGLLGTLPAVVSVLIGWFCASILGNINIQRFQAVQYLTVIGWVLCIAAMLWHPYFPVNKKLWTSSFVLFTSGSASLMLAILVWAIDIRQWSLGEQFVAVFGRNPLFAYALSEVLTIFLDLIKWQENGTTYTLGGWLYTHLFQYIISLQMGSFHYALCFMLLCWWICKVLYDRKIYIKI